MTSAVSFFDVWDSFQDVKMPKTSTSASTVEESQKFVGACILSFFSLSFFLSKDTELINF